MEKHFSGVPPGALLMRKAQIDFIVEFWNTLRIDGDPGSTTWEVLEHFERQVTDCLCSEPPDIDRAEQLTAQAMLMITAQISL